MERFNKLDAQFTLLSNDIAKVKKMAKVAEEKADEAVEIAKSSKSEFNSKYESLLDCIDLIESQLEDQINRNMRSMLVINGIKGNDKGLIS